MYSYTCLLTDAILMAAASPKFVGKAQLMAVSLSSMSEALKSDLTHGIAGRQSLRFSLRLSCRLVTGLWVLYRKKTALTRALAEQCLKMLIQRRKHQTTLNIDLPPTKRQKSAKFETDTTANFGKVSRLLAAPEAGAVSRLIWDFKSFLVDKLQSWTFVIVYDRALAYLGKWFDFENSPFKMLAELDLRKGDEAVEMPAGLTVDA
ncbi:hypothetical protein HPB51_002702 [Rhipicephalus microplus]|uniref:Uncharacterized protein n=1 Tax=Rhipicephalus microplus TaxID=6941 RepID=A0A9J6E6H9_RHIMP|nr:hypothetical protein HPB51_002702 [Rhipicephalus microplus]